MWDWGGFSYVYSMAIVSSPSPIPDGFWVMWEGPPITHTHLAVVPNAITERG